MNIENLFMTFERRFWGVIKKIARGKYTLFIMFFLTLIQLSYDTSLQVSLFANHALCVLLVFLFTAILYLVFFSTNKIIAFIWCIFGNSILYYCSQMDNYATLVFIALCAYFLCFHLYLYVVTALLEKAKFYSNILCNSRDYIIRRIKHKHLVFVKVYNLFFMNFINVMFAWIFFLFIEKFIVAVPVDSSKVSNNVIFYLIGIPVMFMTIGGFSKMIDNSLSCNKKIYKGRKEIEVTDDEYYAFKKLDKMQSTIYIPQIVFSVVGVLLINVFVSQYVK